MINKDSVALFSLREGRCYGGKDKEVHNGGWYNTLGEKIGWGDLSGEDVKNIQKNLKTGELFVVLSESDSFWNFVTKFGMIGSMCATSPNEKNPGQDYIIEHAWIIISGDAVHRRVKYDMEPELIAKIIKEGK